MRGIFSIFFGLIVFIGLVSPIHSHEVKGPKGPIILTVTGNIHHNNRGASTEFKDAFFMHHEKKFDEAYSFDHATLQNLKQHRVTAFAEGWKEAVQLEGPRLEDVLSKAGALGQKYRFLALDGYGADIILEDLEKKNWILALKANDKPLGLGGRGPLWLVFDTGKGKASKEQEAKWVWSVFLIEVE